MFKRKHVVVSKKCKRGKCILTLTNEAQRKNVERVYSFRGQTKVNEMNGVSVAECAQTYNPRMSFLSLGFPSQTNSRSDGRKDRQNERISIITYYEDDDGIKIIIRLYSELVPIKFVNNFPVVEPFQTNLEKHRDQSFLQSLRDQSTHNCVFAITNLICRLLMYSVATIYVTLKTFMVCCETSYILHVITSVMICES